jgi:hypothetical protein
MPSITGSTNSTSTNVYATITVPSLSFADVGADTVSASHYYYPRGSFANDLTQQVPALISQGDAYGSRLTTLAQKTQPLSYASLSSSLSVASAISVGGNISQTSGSATLQALTVPSISCSGTITGTLASASQPNITSLGTLTSIACSGNITQSGGTASLKALTVGGSVTQTAGTASLQALTVPSISCSGTITGTLATAAQPNVTSVGTLSFLSVNGSITQPSGTASLQATTVTGGLTADTATIATIGMTLNGCISIPKPTSTNAQILYSAAFNGTTFSRSFAGSGSLDAWRIQPGGTSGQRLDFDVAAAGTSGSTISPWINIMQLQETCGLVVNSNCQCLAASLAFSNSGRYVEVRSDTANTSYLDLHSQDNQVNDYDCRILSTGGSTSGTAGQGTLSLLAAQVGVGTASPTQYVLCDINGYARFRVPSFSVYRSGSWTVSVNASLLASATVDFNNNPNPSFYGWDNTIGAYKPPYAGYYQFHLYCRASDGAGGAIGFVPQVYDSGTVTRYYPVANPDHTVWMPADPSSRRVGTYSVIVYLSSPSIYFFVTTYASTISWSDVRLSGSFISF